MEEFANQRDTLTEQMLNQKRGQVFSDYVASVRRRMEEGGKIIIYNDAIAQIDALDVQQSPAGFPTGF
jgi:hypothetical protein